MATIQFSNGQTVEFNGTPTPKDVEEIAVKLGLHQPQQKASTEVAPTTPTLGEKLGNRFDAIKKAINPSETAAPVMPLRVAGAVAGGINDTLGAVISPLVEKGVDALSNSETLQKVATTNPVSKGLDAVNAGVDAVGDTWNKFEEKMPGTAQTLRDVGNIASLVPTGKVAQKGVEVMDNLRPTAEQIALERQLKITAGLNEQNSRLKTADKAYTRNTITRATPDGKKVTVTPIDTFAKYGIAPVIDRGGIQMGDYRTGVGELGKIKDKVNQLDAEIDTKLTNNGQKIDLATLEAKAIEYAVKNEDFRQAGTVSQNIARIESRFNDYQMSYGEEIDIAELNNIRKTANKDYSPETQDVSRVVGDVARQFVYEVTPDGSVKYLLQQQGELLAAKKYAEAINGTKVTGGRLGNYALRTAGAIAGTTITNIPVLGPVIGMLGGEAAARALQQSQFKSLWTEIRALIAKEGDQSNNLDPSQSANITPSKASIPQTLPPTT